jgi:hypothetical protein
MDEIALPGAPEVEATPVSGTGVFRCVLDCTTGQQIQVEFTEAELLVAQTTRGAQTARREDLATDLAATTAARDLDIALVLEAAAKDPVIAAIARLAGIEEAP